MSIFMGVLEMIHGVLGCMILWTGVSFCGQCMILWTMAWIKGWGGGFGIGINYTYHPQ